MQAPVLSFDHEGDIPVPVTKTKRKNVSSFSTYRFSVAFCFSFQVFMLWVTRIRSILSPCFLLIRSFRWRKCFYCTNTTWTFYKYASFDIEGRLQSTWIRYCIFIVICVSQWQNRASISVSKECSMYFHTDYSERVEFHCFRSDRWGKRTSVDSVLHERLF